ncbi:hypothetical protein L6452_13238 [Arctium lappa]|uniref:Uncharacterized protein n=1 Tax=Arctium lappa TaxID=4217 RepID=A0ACB9CI11_ARCLA|nr:hypothetical protein L6452_13238 [Arctium lappa]
MSTSTYTRRYNSPFPIVPFHTHPTWQLIVGCEFWPPESMDTTNNNHREMEEEDETVVKYMVGGVVAIHSQVKKIKQELEKTMHPDAALEEHPDMRSVLREFSRQPKRSRSPLGITNRPISVGNS